MNQATKYWVERIKRLTTALGRYKKNTAKLNRILKKMEKDSPQYMEYENELLEQLYKQYEVEKELLAIKCAALTKQSKLSKNAQKANYETNQEYISHLLKDFNSRYGSFIYKESGREISENELLVNLNAMLGNEQTIYFDEVKMDYNAIEQIEKRTR